MRFTTATAIEEPIQDRLSKEGLEGQGKIINEMKGIEQQLLDQGLNERSLQRMMNLNYELLKLKEADLQQGRDNKRQSRTNYQDFSNTLRLNRDIKSILIGRNLKSGSPAIPTSV